VIKDTPYFYCRIFFFQFIMIKREMGEVGREVINPVFEAAPKFKKSQACRELVDSAIKGKAKREMYEFGWE
jgi:hypothetical protein